jgi:hypothetical protein
LRLGDAVAPCLIVNMCLRGFLIKATEDLPVGKLVHLTCELEAGTTIECEVQVRHVNRQCLGAKLVEISDECRTVCRRFLEQQSARAASA